MSAGGWYGRPVAAACAALAACAASAYILAGAEFGSRESSARSAFAVTIRHYGVDAREMERSVAVPLEDALASAAGAEETSSSSEYGKARVLVRFAKGTNTESAYESVRDAAGRIYDRLPSSAQRPEISSTSEGRGPVWVAAVYSDSYAPSALGRILERSVKPALEKLSGAGDVELAGSGLPEITIEVDEAAASAMGVASGSVARALAYGDILAPAGSLLSGGVESAIVADGRFEYVSDLAKALIPSGSGSPVPLGAFSRVIERDRKPEALSRVDGKSAVTIAVNPGGGANLPALSRAIAKETKALSAEYGFTFRVLSDAGADVARSFGSTLSAAAQGALAVALASALLVGKGRKGDGRTLGSRSITRRARIVAVATVPVILAISAAALSALGFGLDRYALAGLAAGLGASVDSAILAAERLGDARSAAEGRAAMKELAPSLASGTATTIVVLIPLSGLDFLSEGVARIAAAIAAVSVAAYLVTVIFMPPLILGGSEDRAGKVGGIGTPERSKSKIPRLERSLALNAMAASFRQRTSRLVRKAKRLLAMNAVLCARKPLFPLAAAACLSVAGIVAILSSPLDSSGSEEENAVYVHVEFEPGAAVDSVDRRLADYATAIAQERGVSSAQATARRGSGSVLVSFDSRLTDSAKVAKAARRIEPSGGFAWIPQSSPRERSWELVIAGDDDAECRRIALLAARAVADLPFVIDTVLNFKDGPEDLVLRPDRERAAALGLGFSQAADSLRRGIHGPVAYKRLGPEGETDVRVTVLRDGEPSIRDAASILVQTQGGAVRVESFMSLSRERDASRINRRDRRRVASVTIRSEAIDPRKARDAVLATLADLPRPAGYSIEFDRDAVKAAERLTGVIWSFLLAAALAYMATASITESFGAPLAVLSALPPSLAVPAVLLAVSGTPMNAAIACAFVAVSGMAVNASVLTVDERRSRSGGGRKPASALELYLITRSRIASLAATCGISVAGSLPFLFLSDSGSAMARSLAFVAATGTAASFIVALTVVPALASVSPRLFNTFSLSESVVTVVKEGNPS